MYAIINRLLAEYEPKQALAIVDCDISRLSMIVCDILENKSPIQSTIIRKINRDIRVLKSVSIILEGYL